MAIPTNEYRVHGDQTRSRMEQEADMLGALESELSELDCVRSVWRESDSLIEVELAGGAGGIEAVTGCVDDWPVQIVTQNEAVVSVRAD